MSRKGYFILGLGIGVIFTALVSIIYYNLSVSSYLLYDRKQSSVYSIEQDINKKSDNEDISITNELSLYHIIKKSIE